MTLFRRELPKKNREASMDELREQQLKQAEELLGDRPHSAGFVKGLFFGDYAVDRLPPYPGPASLETDALVARLQAFCRERIDPVAIDRQAEIPAAVVAGLGQLGVLGACLPRSCGGQALSQTDYCRLLEVLGGHCGSTALFVNAHHSIGPRALVLFGTAEQQRRWLPKLASGEWISAFALTEPEAGSDAANVQTTATPTADGRGFVLNGEKRWITNGGLAQVLTVMARTPGRGGSAITAFLVTPDMPGFAVVERRMDKLGVRGTATSRLAFRDLFVPRENVLGTLGKGLKVALTVLDFGRTTFGACCTGAAKFCVARAVEHTGRRVQFGQTLDRFEMVQEKLAFMQAATFAMEACTYQTAALIDAGRTDFLIETAMLKVFATETLWRILNDTFQLHGGLAYFTDQPFERLLRDARINTIGEGANDVLRAFVALVGLRDVGQDLEAVRNALLNPLAGLTRLGRFAGRQIGQCLSLPDIATSDSRLEPDAVRLARDIRRLGRAGQRLLVTHQEAIVDRQLLLGRLADAATECYVSVCVLRRLDALLRTNQDDAGLRLAVRSGRYYLKLSHRRIRQAFHDLHDNDDAEALALARAMK